MRDCTDMFVPAFSPISCIPNSSPAAFCSCSCLAPCPDIVHGNTGKNNAHTYQRVDRIFVDRICKDEKADENENCRGDRMARHVIFFVVGTPCKLAAKNKNAACR